MTAHLTPGGVDEVHHTCDRLDIDSRRPTDLALAFAMLEALGDAPLRALAGYASLLGTRGLPSFLRYELDPDMHGFTVRAGNVAAAHIAVQPGAVYQLRIDGSSITSSPHVTELVRRALDQWGLWVEPA